MGWVFIFMAWPLYFSRMSSHYPLNWVLGEAQGQARHFREQENLLRLAVFRAFIGRPVMLFAVPATISHLQV
jgi:hypothetical protein